MCFWTPVSAADDSSIESFLAGDKNTRVRTRVYSEYHGKELGSRKAQGTALWASKFRNDGNLVLRI